MKDENVCTKESPYIKGSDGRWAHPDAIIIGDSYGGTTDGDFEKYKCPNCGKTFWVELPN